ncbi:hypothetical protein PRUPE_2G258600 [Prunus persica]|uniref:Uncharacterized protein n=1 Tax=Prunus persica TaxID=3760 RepID=A0A251QLM5_PRUPE|nr:hypothetical protein PRUPE_2G258600 [Prunus persica]
MENTASLCSDNSFPFVGRALVVDLQRQHRRRNRPGGTKVKFLFAYQEIAKGDWCIVASCLHVNALFN